MLWDPRDGFVLYEGHLIPSNMGFGAVCDEETNENEYESKVYAGTVLEWISREEFRSRFPSVPLPV